MITVIEATDNDTRHEVQLTCAACGYDLDERELELDICSDCGVALNLARHVKIYATSTPAAQGAVTL